MSTQLSRLGGLALLIAGLLMSVSAVLHPNDADPQGIFSPAWAPVHLAFIVSILFSLLGLPSLYLAQREQAGRLGLVGFCLTLTGAAFFIFPLGFEALVLPPIAANPANAAMLAPDGPLFGGALGLTLIAASIIFSAGALLFGAAMIRAKAFSPLLGLTFMIGGPLLGFTPPLPQLAGMIGAVVLGIGYCWAGYLLQRQQAAAVMHTHLA